jgi:membrane protease YdiL (CAAX protease family)
VVAIVFGFLILNLGYIEILQGLPDWAALNRELHHGTSARALWVMLLNFLPLLMMLWVVLTLLHRRSLRRMAGPWTLVRLDFKRTVRLLVVLYAGVLLLPAPADMSPMQNMPFADWIWLLPVSLPLILLQTSTEEFLFRGYLQSQLAARFSSPLVWMVLPSLLFGFLHYDPATYGPNALPLAAWSALFGLAAADLTARAGNLGPALALHFLNNVVAMNFTAMEGHWDGLALFVLPFGPENVEALRATMPIELLLILCGWLTVRIAIRR